MGNNEHCHSTHGFPKSLDTARTQYSQYGVTDGSVIWSVDRNLQVPISNQEVHRNSEGGHKRSKDSTINKNLLSV